MKPPFQYPRRAEADNFRTKVKLVRSAFRSPRSIAVGSHQPRRGPALLVNGFSSAATAYLNRVWSSEVPNHKQCRGPTRQAAINIKLLFQYALRIDPTKRHHPVSL